MKQIVLISSPILRRSLLLCQVHFVKTAKVWLCVLHLTTKPTQILIPKRAYKPLSCVVLSAVVIYLVYLLSGASYTHGMDSNHQRSIPLHSSRGRGCTWISLNVTVPLRIICSGDISHHIRTHKDGSPSSWLKVESSNCPYFQG